MTIKGNDDPKIVSTNSYKDTRTFGDERILLVMNHSLFNLELQLPLLVDHFDLRTIVAHLLLRHLKASRPKLYRLHFLSTIAFSRARRLLGHWLVTYHWNG